MATKKKPINRSIKKMVKKENPPAPEVKQKVPKTKVETAEETTQPVLKIESWFVDMSSLEKNSTDPKGTMIIVKDKNEEIGIHIDPTNSSLLFSHYPKKGAELKSVPFSIKEIVKFISQKV